MCELLLSVHVLLLKVVQERTAAGGLLQCGSASVAQERMLLTEGMLRSSLVACAWRGAEAMSVRCCTPRTSLSQEMCDGRLRSCCASVICLSMLLPPCRAPALALWAW